MVVATAVNVDLGLAGPAVSPPAIRMVDATLRCIARWGVAKTTLDDVAREAGCSRATVYRLFPGGKDGLLDAVARTETERFFAGLAEHMAGAESLEELVVAGVGEAGRRLVGHPALRFLAACEPDALLPLLSFAQKDRVLGFASSWAEPWLRPWLGDHAGRAVEWIARLVLSYAACPADGIDLSDGESVRRLVTTFVLPGLARLAEDTSAPTSRGSQ
ncbi:MAG TPA: TetR/AcrR family transcriptional regulator [Acidimicrobiales bacterium]